MKYVIKDLQFPDRYFGGDYPVVFNSKKEVCEQLISYHSISCNMEIEERLLNTGKIEKCLNAVLDFGWKIEYAQKIITGCIEKMKIEILLDDFLSEEYQESLEDNIAAFFKQEGLTGNLLNKNTGNEVKFEGKIK